MSQQDLSVEVMFEYLNGGNIPWQWPEYQPVAKYQTLGSKTPIPQSATKKGNYLDYQLKIAEGIPSPQHYKQIRVWSARSNRSPKIDTSLKKYTYLDLIETEQKNRKTPAPGDYKLSASEAELKQMQTKLDQKCKKRNVSEKRYFYEDEQYLSERTPGPGNYNPRPVKKKVRPNQKDHKFWVQKHRKHSQSVIEKAKKDPDMGSYTPIAAQYNTFARYQASKETMKKQKKPSPCKPWGTGTRFSYDVKSKTPKNQGPEPATYNLILDWPSKPHPRIKQKAVKVDWINKLSRPNSSVYH